MALLENRNAIVSGAARGLGAAFAEALAGAGARVFLFDVDEAVRETAQAIGQRVDVPVTGMVADVSKRSDVEAVVQSAADAGGVHVLVNNAGVWRRTPVDSPWEQALEDWSYTMDTNLKGALMLSRACIPIMQAQREGHIVNVSTYYVLPARSAGTNPPDTDLYNASKWALNGFTDAWAKYLSKDNIRVNALCMGATDTPMLRGLFADGQLPGDLAASVMQPEQIAHLMMDLIEDGRSGENIGAWVGEPVALTPPRPEHRRITG